MAVKERNDSPRKPIGERFFSAVFFFFFSIRLFIEAAQLGEMGFDALAMGLVGWVPESQY